MDQQSQQLYECGIINEMKEMKLKMTFLEVTKLE
jgi:hypothetical protein